MGPLDTFIRETTQPHKIVPRVYKAGMASSNEHDFSPTRWDRMPRHVEEVRLNNRGYPRTLFDFSPIGLALVTLDGTVVDGKTPYAAIIGRTREDSIGLTDYEPTPKR